MEKSDLLREFSANSEMYYRVKLFTEKGFERRSCGRCHRYFWTMDPARTLCPDDSPDIYSFIGDPPTTRRFDYTEAWKQIESFFIENEHTSVSRYPVVCRWRDDLFFTVASIVDFQRVVGSKVVFEFPANPLIVPQTCLRFKDLENVGVTGRHFSSFCMVGQHAVPEGGGYWKDRCIELDYTLLTERLGIPGEEVTFVEDVWSGGGSFGPSLEYFVRGLELGNAVFTEFQGELGKHTTLDRRIIDMGAGLERFAWITMGTPTAYDCCFGPVTRTLCEAAGVDPDLRILTAYFIEVAKAMGRLDRIDYVRSSAVERAGLAPGDVERLITPLEGIYLIADHLRTLIFAIADGALPSNVGGGYNLRVMLRRISGTADRIGLNIDVPELIDLHVDYLMGMYPELDERRNDIKTIMEIEWQRYMESKFRMGRIAQKVVQKRRPPTVDELITLYESDGVTPDYLVELGAMHKVPPTFYTRLSQLHQASKRDEAVMVPVDGMDETIQMYYVDDPMEFDAKVLRVIDNKVVLDRTSFYARGGGQEPDHGSIGGFAVVDVQRHAGVILHMLEGGVPKEGEMVSCSIDRRRRNGITKHHTSTHILNASSRKVLGSWVWQNSAFKEEDHARLDITHHSSLTDEQVQQIEDEANLIVGDDLPVAIEWLERGEAERRYGFRIYQGGVVPVRSVRVVSIADRDVEACGGTHVRSTGEIDSIRITRTKRIQDGVVRLEFVAGKAAAEHRKKMLEDDIGRKKAVSRRESVLRKRGERRALTLHDIPVLLAGITTSKEPQKRGTGIAVQVSGANCVMGGIGDGRSHRNAVERWRTSTGWFYCTSDARYGERFHVKFGKEIVKTDPSSIYCGVFTEGATVKVLVYAGERARSTARAADVARMMASELGGSSGGTAAFAQGGGKDQSMIEAAVSRARAIAMGV